VVEFLSRSLDHALPSTVHNSVGNKSIESGKTGVVEGRSRSWDGFLRDIGEIIPVFGGIIARIVKILCGRQLPLKRIVDWMAQQ
jgi:hypothetical protein